MKTVKQKHVRLACMCLCVCAILVASGVFNHWLWLMAGVALAGYWLIDKRYLRCPHCGIFINLDQLMYASRHTYHCRSCGQVIRIER